MNDLFSDPPIDLDEYIAKLEELRAKHGGNTLVQRWNVSKGRHNATFPKEAYTKVVVVGRHRTPIGQFYQEGYDKPEEKGTLVIRV